LKTSAYFSMERLARDGLLDQFRDLGLVGQMSLR
jgi:hypothetical protein